MRSIVVIFIAFIHNICIMIILADKLPKAGWDKYLDNDVIAKAPTTTISSNISKTVQLLPTSMQATLINASKTVKLQSTSLQPVQYNASKTDWLLSTSMASSATKTVRLRSSQYENDICENCANATKILTLPQLDPTTSTKLRSSIDRAPSQVNDFQCTGYDFDYMICNFTMPSSTTNYTLTLGKRKPVTCTHNRSTTEADTMLVNCEHYDASLLLRNKTFTFNLELSNAFGKRQQSFNVNSYQRMVPATPGDYFQVYNVTRNGITLKWNLGSSSYARPFLIFEACVSAFKCIEWRDQGTGMFIRRHIGDLPYAGYIYELSLRVRLNSTTGIWSERFVHEFETLADRPVRPPTLTDGSFYVYASKTELRVYWEELEPHEYNGKNLSYIITSFRRNNTIIIPTSNIVMSKSSALIIDWRSDASYDLEIRSRNHYNVSLTMSHLRIPPLPDADVVKRHARNVQSIFDASDPSYTLFWDPPIEATQLLSYTVYWCSAKTALPMGCADSVHSHQVPITQLNYTIKSAEYQLLNMAVSADYVDFNAGMYWPKCKGDTANDLPPMLVTVGVVTNSTILIKWVNNEAICTAMLTGYKLNYCERPQNSNDTCTTRQIDRSVTIFDIGNLKPFTEYKVSMLMYADNLNKTGQYGDPILVRTAEAAPTPPQLLQCIDLTSDSATLTWHAPTNKNGIIRAYVITVNDQHNEEIEIVDDAAKVYEHRLNNLTAHTVYKVSVRARTLYYSEPSKEIRFMTAVGAPSEPETLDVVINDEYTLLKWTAPTKPAGRLDYYEISISEYNANKILLRQYNSFIMSKHGNCFCQMLTPKCIPQYQYDYEVRAVNVQPLPSPLNLRHQQRNQQQNEENQQFDQQNQQRNHQHQNQRHSHYRYKQYDAKHVLQCKRMRPSNKCDDHNDSSDIKLLQNYTNDQFYRQYMSLWKKRTIYCTSNTDSNVSTIIFCLIVAIIFVMLILKYSWNKYHKMSNIYCKLPIGLDTICPKQLVEMQIPLKQNTNLRNDTTTIELTKDAQQQLLEQSRLLLQQQQENELDYLTNDVTMDVELSRMEKLRSIPPKQCHCLRA